MIDWAQINTPDEQVRLAYLNTLTDADLETVERQMNMFQRPEGGGSGAFMKNIAKGAANLGWSGVKKAAGAAKNLVNVANQGATQDPFGNLGVGKIKGPTGSKTQTNSSVAQIDQRFSNIQKKMNSPIVSQDIKTMFQKDFELWKKYKPNLSNTDSNTPGWMRYFDKNLYRMERGVGIAPVS